MRDDENQLNPAERELERALQSLAPAPLSLNRDDVIFQAGERSTRQQLRIWRGAAGGLAACALAAAMIPVVRPPQTVNVVNKPTEILLAPMVARQIQNPYADPYSVVALGRAVLDGGIDGLPSTSNSPSMERRQETPSLRPSSILED
jgi:hypothetical protein